MDAIIILNLIRNFLLYTYFCVIVPVWSRLKFRCKAKIASGLRCHCRHGLKEAPLVLGCLAAMLWSPQFCKVGKSWASSSSITTWTNARFSSARWQRSGLLEGSCKQVCWTPAFQIPASPKPSLLLKNTCKGAATAAFGYFSSFLLQNLLDGKDQVQEWPSRSHIAQTFKSYLLSHLWFCASF